MSTMLQKDPAPEDTRQGRSIHQPTLPRWVPAAVLIAALAAGGVISGFGWIATPVIGGLLYLAGIYVISRFYESARRATDRLVTGIVTSMFVVALVPLVSVIWTVASKGAQSMNATFFSYNMRNVVGDVPGGIQHAIWGTLIITALAALISVPIGVFTSIYLVEYGTGWLSRQVRFLVDVMTGIPSIVAGLFAYAMFELIFGPGVRVGIGGAVALSVLMIPVVVRSTEEMLKLVPNELREASYALGVPKWRTITKVVLPTALAGIATGVTLAIARVIGETAPLLIIVGITDSTNLNPLDGRMATLPVFTYYQYTQPGIPPEFAIDRAWGAALTLMIIVLVLNLFARVISYIFSPKKA